MWCTYAHAADLGFPYTTASEVNLLSRHPDNVIWGSYWDELKDMCI